MIHRLYNPWHISNSGEKEADKLMVLPPDLAGEEIHIQHHLRISSTYHQKQMVGECDFVVISRHGVVVVEVKGGVLGFGDAGEYKNVLFRKLTEDDREVVKDPWMQVDANAAAVQSFLRNKNVFDVFVARAVCFPECIFDATGVSKDFLWHRQSARPLIPFLLGVLQEQKQKYLESQRTKNKLIAEDFKELDDARMKEIAGLLQPSFDSSLLYQKQQLNLEESSRKALYGWDILRGLMQNARIMVQGPPGSGKSTWAFELIKHLCHSKNRKGLYLCWNELLATRMQQRFDEDEILKASIRAVPYYKFYEEMVKSVALPAETLTYEKVKEGKMADIVRELLLKSRKNKTSEIFDFIVADEAQDLFDKGLELSLKYLIKGNNPLLYGNYYIFFDDSQSYPGGHKNLELYVRTRDMLRESSASYVLSENLRVNTGHGLTDFIRDAASGTLGTNYGADVKFSSYKNDQELAGQLANAVLNEKTVLKRNMNEMVLLFSSGFLKQHDELAQLLAAGNTFAKLDTKNTNPAGKLQYTTMLKAKGLEWDSVFLVFDSLDTSRAVFEAFIGASRARSGLRIFVKEDVHSQQTTDDS